MDRRAARPTVFCFAGLFVVIESWLNASAAPEAWDQTLGFNGMTGLIAGICGQMRLTRSDPAEWTVDL